MLFYKIQFFAEDINIIVYFIMYFIKFFGN